MILKAIPPALRPYAKAVTPAFLALVAALLSGLQAGAFDPPQLEVAIVGLAAASVTYAVPNLPAGVGRYAKAVTPAVLTIAAVAAHFLVTGDYDAAEARLAATGLASAVVAFLVPNQLAAPAPDHEPSTVPPLLATEKALAIEVGQERALQEAPPLTEITR